MGGLGGMAGLSLGVGQVYAADAVRVTTPFEKVTNARGQVDGLVQRVATLAARLVGPSPDASSTKPTNPRMGTLFHAIGDEAEDISDAVKLGHEELDRIERMLP